MFGGYRNVTKDTDATLNTTAGNFDNRPHSFQVRSVWIAANSVALLLLCSRLTNGPDAPVPGACVSSCTLQPRSQTSRSRRANSSFAKRLVDFVRALLEAWLTSFYAHPSQVYAPARTCAVYGPAEWADKDADRKPHGVPGLGVKDLGPYFSR